MSSYLPWITGPAGGLVILAIGWVLLMTGKIHSDGEYQALKEDRDYWRDAFEAAAQARDIERRIATETAQAGQVANQVLEILADVASARAGIPPRPKRKPGPMTAKDLGL